MANTKHLALIIQGVVAWNGWRAANPKLRPDLLGAPLFGANLCGVNLREADLRGADLSYAKWCIRQVMRPWARARCRADDGDDGGAFVPRRRGAGARSSSRWPAR